MSHQNRTRASRRAALVAGGLAAVLLPLGFAAPAVAGPPSGAKARQAVTAGEDTPATVTRVTEFYEGYLAALAKGDRARAEELRRTYLDAAFLRRLEQWESEHHANGVTRSQDAPRDADVAYDGSAMGRSYAVVTLHYGPGSTRQVHVESSLETQKITDITD